MDRYGRQAYVRDYDPADLVAQAKATIARNRAAAEQRATAPDDLEDSDHAA